MTADGPGRGRWFLVTVTLFLVGALIHAEDRPRVRDLGVKLGVLQPGPLNAITDVAGVRVGHKTIIRGEAIRTGVTAVLPHEGNLFQEKVVAAVYPGNAFGKAAGFLQVDELGNIETPIVLTNTLSVGTAVQAVVKWTLRQPGNETVGSVNAVVGETNDGYLNDIRRCAVSESDVYDAIERAVAGPVAEGNVGAGTGTQLFGWKGGIGTASRVLPDALGGYTLGALVQTNFGGILSIDGHRVGEALGRYSFRSEIESALSSDPGPGRNGDGSCMVILATDAPLSPRNLKRIARRAVLGLARTGSFMSHGSGDFVIAFSTRNRVPYGPKSPTRTVEELQDDFVSPLFLATVEAVEEAVLNSLFKAETMNGRDGNRLDGFPVGAFEEMIGSRVPRD